MKSTLFILATFFFGLAGLLFTGTLQELIHFGGSASEIACFSLAFVGGAICLVGAFQKEIITPRTVANPSPSFHAQDIEIEADRWEEREAIVREMLEMEN